jgi:hypothetical protein
VPYVWISEIEPVGEVSIMSFSGITVGSFGFVIIASRRHASALS